MKFNIGKKTYKVRKGRVLKVAWASFCLVVIVSMMASSFAYAF